MGCMLPYELGEYVNLRNIAKRILVLDTNFKFHVDPDTVRDAVVAYTNQGFMLIWNTSLFHT